MSIRTKLWASHSLMVLMPVALIVVFAHLLFHLFSGQWNAVRSHYHLDGYTLEDFMHGEMMAIAELQTTMRNNPDRLLDGKVLDGYGERLAGRGIHLALFRSDALHYASDELEAMAARLPVYRLGPDETYSFDEQSLERDGRRLIGFRYAFRFEDGGAGNLFLLLDAAPVSKLVNRVLPSLALAFLAAFLAASVLLTLWMSRRILHPIRQLRQAVERVKEGDLEHAVEVRGHDELGQLGGAFEEMRKRLDESVRERLRIEENRKELIAHISHDLKTPITAILGYAEGMVDGVAVSPERMEKYARTIHMHALDLDRLVDELFLYSKLDLNRVAFQFTTLDLREYASRLAEEYKLRMEEQGISLESALPDEPVWVHADPEQLKRVLANIIGNSVKYMDKDEKRIVVRMAPDEDDAGYVRVDIRDNGAGIDRRDLPRVLEQFYRGDAARRDGGSGLGLAIAGHIVKAHGGKIHVDSELGKGTTVTFTLRAADRP